MNASIRRVPNIFGIWGWEVDDDRRTLVLPTIHMHASPMGAHDAQDRCHAKPPTGKFGSEKAPSKNTHPTVKPQELMKYLCRMVTPKGGTVLDIFMGSGSTGMAAKDEGFDFIGIERDKEYFNIAEKRIKIKYDSW